MKQLKFMPVLVLILAFAIITPVSAMHNPVDNNQLIKRMLDDHPWGGEAVPTHSIPDRSEMPVEFIDMPFIYIDIYQIIIIGDFRFGDDSNPEDQSNGEILPEDYNTNNYNNQDLPSKGN